MQEYLTFAWKIIRLKLGSDCFKEANVKGMYNYHSPLSNSQCRVIRQDGITIQEAYANSLEHLFDELKYLDLLIKLLVLEKQNIQTAGPLEQFKGLVLSEEEIKDLLTKSVSLQVDKNLNEVQHKELQELVNELQKLETVIATRKEASLQQGVYLSLPFLSKLFGLLPFEERCIIICLAPELDRKYEKIYAYLQDDITLKKPCVDLVLQLLCTTIHEKLAYRRSFKPKSPLVKYLLHPTNIHSDDSPPLISKLLKLDDRIVNFLLEFEEIDNRLDSFASIIYPMNEFEKNIVDEQFQKIFNFIGSNLYQIEESRNNLIIHFIGSPGSGKKFRAKIICSRLGIPLIIVNVIKILTGQTEFEDILQIAGREAVLHQAALCFENFDSLFFNNDKTRIELQSFCEMIRTFSPLIFLTGTHPLGPRYLKNNDIVMEFACEIPSGSTRNIIWHKLSKGYPLDETVNLNELSSKFRFTPGQIKNSLNVAKNLARWNSVEEGKITAVELYKACRDLSNQRLGTLAKKIKARYSWGDIILPPEQKEQLREICTQVIYRHVVYDEWNLGRKSSYGKGLSVLFSGPSGTGKTMAAEVIANELRLDLYKVDLSQVVSKYIGETEKNLQQIFEEAETTNAILFFDEADALFGKRSEVKDAHDRYSNVETAYLLQKMEESSGLTILATNLPNNMDNAFIRRIQYNVKFPFPDTEERRNIWQLLIPATVPKGKDINLSFLADKFELAGGNIRNIVINAAFLAVEDNRILEMKHLIRATKRELQKMGRVCTPDIFGEYFNWLK